MTELASNRSNPVGAAISRIGALAGVGRWEEAVRCGRSELANFPDDPWLLSMLSWAEAGADRIQEAVVHAEQAVHLAPDRASIVRMAAVVLRRDPKRLEAAAELACRALAIDPTDVHSHIEVACCELLLGRVAEARRAVERALQLDPGSVDARRVLVEVAIAEQSLDEASEQARIVVAERPDDPSAIRALAGILSQADGKDPSDLFRRAAAISPGSTAPLSSAIHDYREACNALIRHVEGPDSDHRLELIAAEVRDRGENFLSSCITYQRALMLSSSDPVKSGSRDDAALRLVHRSLHVDWQAEPPADIQRATRCSSELDRLRTVLESGGRPLRRELWINAQNYAARLHVNHRARTNQGRSLDLERARRHVESAERASVPGASTYRVLESKLALAEAFINKGRDPRAALPLLEEAAHGFAASSAFAKWATAQVATGVAWINLVDEQGLLALDHGLAALRAAIDMPACGSHDRAIAHLRAGSLLHTRFYRFWDSDALDLAERHLALAEELFEGRGDRVRVSAALAAHAKLLDVDPRVGRRARHASAIEMFRRSLAAVPDNPQEHWRAHIAASLAWTLRDRTGRQYDGDRDEAVRLAATAAPALTCSPLWAIEVTAMCLLNRRNPPRKRDLVEAIKLIRDDSDAIGNTASAVTVLDYHAEAGRVLRQGTLLLDPALGDEAVSRLRNVLGDRPLAAAPRVWTRAQFELGNLYRDVPAEDNETSLARATRIYDEVLSRFTADQDPRMWGEVQGHLATACGLMVARGRAAARKPAIEATEAALDVVKGSDDPVLRHRLLELHRRLA